MKKLHLLLLVIVLATLGSACKEKKAATVAEPLQLPVIHIVTKNEISWDKRIPCVMSVVTNHDSVSWGGKVKFRGGMSSKYYKHSYSVKLSGAQSLCGMPENRSWILNASYIDKTFMRHKLCYDLFNMMRLRPRTREQSAARALRGHATAQQTCFKNRRQRS